MRINKNKKLKLLKEMLRIRQIETSIAKKYKCDYYHKRSAKNSRDKSTDYDVFKKIVTFFINKKIKNSND